MASPESPHPSLPATAPTYHNLTDAFSRVDKAAQRILSQDLGRNPSSSKSSGLVRPPVERRALSELERGWQLSLPDDLSFFYHSISNGHDAVDVNDGSGLSSDIWGLKRMEEVSKPNSCDRATILGALVRTDELSEEGTTDGSSAGADLLVLGGDMDATAILLLSWADASPSSRIISAYMPDIRDGGDNITVYLSFTHWMQAQAAELDEDWARRNQRHVGAMASIPSPTST